MMTAQRTKPVKEAASEFLANKRIAVTGVSRTSQGHGGNVVTNACGSVATRCSRLIRTQTRSKATSASTT
jgi:hypothetical protein